MDDTSHVIARTVAYVVYQATQLFFIFFFFFNDTATTEIYTLSLHDALPISRADGRPTWPGGQPTTTVMPSRGLRGRVAAMRDRKSTRLNSSHSQISYAVFCLKKKKNDAVQRYNVTCAATLVGYTTTLSRMVT